MSVYPRREHNRPVYYRTVAWTTWEESTQYHVIHQIIDRCNTSHVRVKNHAANGFAFVSKVVRWGWNTFGWASAFSDDPLFGCGALDFAGTGVVSQARVLWVAYVKGSGNIELSRIVRRL